MAYPSVGRLFYINLGGITMTIYETIVLIAGETAIAVEICVFCEVEYEKQH